MNVRLNRELKHYCPDFRPIRRLLRRIDATPRGTRRQVDYFYHLPDGSRRLKLRVQHGGQTLIYYYDRYGQKSRSVEFQLFEVRDPQLRKVLETALGVRAVVRKRRELWMKGATKFHLDRVAGVGQVFEVEIEARRGDGAARQLARYRELFGPHLGRAIRGSNEDLVSAHQRHRPAAG
ncbi:MAG: class IV adenylate cyclase [Chloroflexi bacterium]|nr:class IV adenylate cyclase [Chloroflexota bacterium]